MSSGSVAERVRALGPRRGAALLRRARHDDPRSLATDWSFWSRPAQRAPTGSWRVWLVMAGRGFGKTRCGAEWVLDTVRANPRCRIALVAATLAEGRAIMVEGESGLLACAAASDELLWSPSLNRLMWGNGATARLFSAAEPESLRGPDVHFAWCDEIGKWPGGEAAWDNLALTLRKGAQPRVVATTTPRAVPLVRRLMRDPGTAVTRGRTADNAANLSPAFLAQVTALYGGTRLGRQELDGELIEDVEGALWTRAMVEAAREARSSPAQRRGGGGAADGGAAARAADAAPVEAPSLAALAPLRRIRATSPAASPGEDLTRIVIAVDPPASATGDACGIVACGLDRAGIGHVLEDASVEGASPEGWARAVAECAARWGADRVIAEANNGGEMVRSTLRAFDPGLPVALAHASRGKGARAEPVALLYQQGRVRHRGVFPKLEDQLCGLTPGGYVGPGRSPDRADALVWALTELMVRVRRAEPRVRAL